MKFHPMFFILFVILNVVENKRILLGYSIKSEKISIFLKKGKMVIFCYSTSGNS